MAIDWNLAKTPLSNTAPTGGGVLAAQGVQQGALAGVAPQMAASQSVLAQADAAHAPQMAQLKQAMASGAIKTQDLQNAQQTYSLAQNILGPSAIAAQHGDMKAAADIYENGLKQLQGAGIDTKSLGAPDKFDAGYVQSAYQNVSQQMAMANQMMQMAQAQSMISYHDSIQNKNAAQVGQINYETGSNFPLGNAAPQSSLRTPNSNMQSALAGITPEAMNAGSTGTPKMAGPVPFSQVPTDFNAPPLPQQNAMQQAPGVANGLTPKGQAEVNKTQADEAIKARAALALQANAARTNIGFINEGLDLLEKHPSAAGRPGLITQYTNPAINRLGAVLDQLKLNKIGTEYSGQGLGPLDVAVAKVLFSTTAGISDPYENQKLALQNSLVAAKGVIMNNDIASRLNEAGVYNENKRALIGQQIAAKLNIKEGSKLNLQNFNNSEKIISEVLQKNGISSPEVATETPATFALTPQQVSMRNNAIQKGANPAEIDAYFKAVHEKQG